MTDRFPQILTASTGTAGAVDDYVVATVNLPRGDISTGRGRRMVYELLKVWFYPGIADRTDIAQAKMMAISTTQIRASADTCNAATVQADMAEPTVIAAVYYSKIATTSGSQVTTFPLCVDLTDEAGNGTLVATDRIFLTGGDISGTTVANFVCKILYRVVSVPALEFVGIVQSQISGT